MLKHNRVMPKVLILIIGILCANILLSSGYAVEKTTASFVNATKNPESHLVTSKSTVSDTDNAVAVSHKIGSKKVLSFDKTTCGPAAMYLVLKMYGKHVSLEKIGGDTWVDTDRRTTIKSLSKAFAKQGIYARGCKLTLEELEQRRFPTIILSKNKSNRKENHFLIYLGSNNNKVNILDPLFKPFVVLTKEIFKSRWDGVAIVTQPTPFVKYEHNRSSYWTIFMIGSIFLLLSVAIMTCLKTIVVRSQNKKMSR